MNNTERRQHIQPKQTITGHITLNITIRTAGSNCNYHTSLTQKSRNSDEDVTCIGAADWDDDEVEKPSPPHSEFRLTLFNQRTFDLGVYELGLSFREIDSS